MRLSNIFKYFNIFLFLFVTVLLFYLINLKFGKLTNIIENKTQLFFNIILLLIISYLILSFFLSRNIKIIINITGISIIISILIIEAYLQINHLKFIKGDLDEKKKIYKKNTGNIYDVRSKFEFYKELKKKYSNLSVPITVPMVLESKQFKKENFLPISGISNKKTIHCNENGYYSIYDSDRFGFNNDDDIWNLKNQNKVILLGDSFVHGACVFRKDSFAGILKNLNEKFEFYNLSYSEHGPLEQLVALREYSKIIKPNYIIWFYYEGNDLADLSGSLKNQILSSYLNDSNFNQDLAKKVQLSDKIYKEILNEQIKKRKIKFHSAGFNFESFFKLSYLRKTVLNFFIKPQLPFTEFEKIMRMVYQIAEKENIDLYVIYLPDYHRYYYKKENDLDYLNYEKVLKILSSTNIKVIDINKELKFRIDNKKKIFPFQKFGHYNEMGYKLISSIINEKIFKN